MEKKALGRGLGALLPAIDDKKNKENQIVMDIEVDHVLPNKNQPRKNFSAQELEQLSESITQSGVLQPIVVRRKGDGFFEIIAGERRWRAAKNAGFSTIPATIRNCNDNQAMLLALVENLQRHDLNPLETANAYHRMNTEFGLTQEQIAKELGIDRSSVANLIRIVTLPQTIKESIASGQLSLGHAKVILGLDELQAQEQLAKKIIEAQLSVRQTENIVTIEFKIKKHVSRKSESNLNHDLEAKIQKRLGTKVSILSKGKGGGKVVIHYFSDQDLERVLEMLLP